MTNIREIGYKKSSFEGMRFIHKHHAPESTFQNVEFSNTGLFYIFINSVHEKH